MDRVLAEMEAEGWASPMPKDDPDYLRPGEQELTFIRKRPR
jgi:hypothetical protein